MITLRFSTKVALAVVGFIAAGMAVWWALSDIRVKSWPANMRFIYARGSIHDYLEMRCIAPRTVRFVKHGGTLEVAGVHVGAYTGQAEDVSVWEIGGMSAVYPVMVSIFPDGEYAVTWWHDLNDGSRTDTYVSSKLWGDASASERRPISAGVLNASDMPARPGCKLN